MFYAYGDPNNPNLYNYCANNPLKYTDPTGKWTEEYNKYHQGLSNQTESFSPPNPSTGTPENANPNPNLPVSGKITSNYGVRDYLYPGEFHPGVDIKAEEGTPVKATADGVIVYAGTTTGGYGNVVVIDNGIDPRTGKHMYTMFEHNKDDGILVKIGQTVQTGDVIALSGNTGKSSGPHVHYTIVAVPEGGASWFIIDKDKNGTPTNFRTTSQTYYDPNDKYIAPKTSYRRLYSVNPLC